MNNYCSIGVDAFIGFSFDKRRTRSQLGNKAVYVTQGAIKALRPPPSLENAIERVTEINPATGEEIVVATAKTDKGFPSLRRKPQSFCYMNISSISAGADPWRYSNHAGLKRTPGKQGEHVFYKDGSHSANGAAIPGRAKTHNVP